MHHFITLRCSYLLFLLTTGNSAPSPVDSMKNNFKLLADTTLIRIKKLINEFQISPNIVISDVDYIPNTTLEKPLVLCSVTEKLNTFQLIFPKLPLDGMSQIQSDVVGLLDITKRLANSCRCPEKKPMSDARLDASLKDNAAFHLLIANIALTRLQELLRKLISNLDQLKNC
ncbi:hypothetical protein COCON_G00121700 [Conger conger]|uniref:Leptin n=1 Tax=Conger conger TaxID=82655 RepID=A0A9Q1DGY5_CONCO|nr:hypothetical protein COCON_G00121700 [Conger conger]